ncbi:MAG: 23S rRNA (adenine(2503)-C(2))-methyltransferase RlmN [Oligoflexia bacterium]|nr:23S rRNA (adenine(2503)-C(2))-methyltransferase RlmN [Oligoflexia bacterium]
MLVDPALSESAGTLSPAEGRAVFYDLSRDELATFLAERTGSTTYRSTQIFEWVYGKGVTDFAQMSNVARSMREQCRGLFEFPEAKILSRQISRDGTRKYLFEVSPGRVVESVMIKQPARMTLCVSSQIGCAMKCAFCRTGTMGLKGNLRTSEIIAQVLGVIKDAQNFGDKFSNMVFMGMGEPLHNLENVARAVRILTDHFGLSIPGRKITVSTVGLVPAIQKFGAMGLDANLAVSLNATTDQVRSKIMPINKRFPIDVLLQTLEELPRRSRRKITIEYVMLAGVNDSDDDLRRLPKLLRKIPSKLNLIPYNTNADLGFDAPERAEVMRWHKWLNDNGMDTTVRWSKGQDIQAACGQLAVEKETAAVALA